MKIFKIGAMTAAMICMMTVAAMATPINGAISFSGTSVTDNEVLSLAKAFTAFSNVVVSTTGGTQDYSGVESGQAVTFNPFVFLPIQTPNPLLLWSFVDDGKTYTFDSTGINLNVSTSHTLALRGTGIAHITGFDDTPGNWYFSANRAGGTASFSTSAEVRSVPEPATMLLFGSGLLGLGLLSRRKKTDKE